MVCLFVVFMFSGCKKSEEVDKVITTTTVATTSSTTTTTVRPIWSKTGQGDNVFDMPTYVSRVRIIGTYTGSSSNFIVKVGGKLLVNELLGTYWGQTRYDGTLLTTGGVAEITNSSGVSWSFEEVR